jgi:ATP-dependent Clp protease ATP-binding subunit ClpA
MTSNAGTNFKSNNIGFGKEGYDALENKVKEALKEYFRPEFLNRVDETIVFKPFRIILFIDVLNILFSVFLCFCITDIVYIEAKRFC